MRKKQKIKRQLKKSKWKIAKIFRVDRKVGGAKKRNETEYKSKVNRLLKKEKKKRK